MAGNLARIYRIDEVTRMMSNGYGHALDRHGEFRDLRDNGGRPYVPVVDSSFSNNPSFVALVAMALNSPTGQQALRQLNNVQLGKSQMINHTLATSTIDGEVILGALKDLAQPIKVEFTSVRVVVVRIEGNPGIGILTAYPA